MSVVETRGTGAMQVPESPPAVRSPRRSWRDPRLVIGVLLIGAAVAAMAWVFASADDGIEVWSVADDVPAGSPVDTGTLAKVKVDVPNPDVYLPTDFVIPAGTVAARDFAAGEPLTPLGLDEPGDSELVRIVTLPVLRHQMPADLSVGDRVDVYLVERGASGEPQARPQLVLPSATVTDVGDNGGAFGGASLETGVALSVPQDDVATVVDAQARGSVTLVDVPVGSS